MATKGQADVSSGRAMQAGDRFRMGEVTETFTATVVLQLVDEGRVKLDDPLSEYFPGATQVAAITVRQLLNHTSGLFDYRDDEAFQGVMQQQPARRWSPEELVGIAFTHPPNFPPGQEFRYSSTDYVILSLLVKTTTASDLEEEVNRRIIDRAGLLNTYFIHNLAMVGQYSHGYLQLAGGSQQDVSNLFDPSWVWAAGAMTSNQDDLEAFARVLANGDLLSRASQRERLKTVPAVLEGSKMDYGLGIASWRGFLGYAGYYPGLRLRRVLPSGTRNDHRRLLQPDRAGREFRGPTGLTGDRGSSLPLLFLTTPNDKCFSMAWRPYVIRARTSRPPGSWAVPVRCRHRRRPRRRTPPCRG